MDLWFTSWQTSKVGSVDDNGSGRGYAYRASKSALNQGEFGTETLNNALKTPLRAPRITNLAYAVASTSFSCRSCLSVE